jgi:hypothetical protein
MSGTFVRDAGGRTWQQLTTDSGDIYYHDLA